MSEEEVEQATPPPKTPARSARAGNESVTPRTPARYSLPVPPEASASSSRRKAAEVETPSKSNVRFTKKLMVLDESDDDGHDGSECVLTLLLLRHYV